MSLTVRRIGLLSFCVLMCFTALIVSGCTKEKKTEYPQVTSEPTTKQPEVPIVWPYTGLEAPSATDITKRPVSIKIENSNPARPQKGLNSADVVYETIAEGGITRFNCIFQSNVPAEVGPVRSARLSDIYIVPQYNTMLFFSGANKQVLARIKEVGINNMSQNKAASLYHRVSFKAAPHNLYLKTKHINKVAESHGYSLTTDNRALSFEKIASQETSSAATKIKIPFSYYAKIEWDFDANTNTYTRINSGEMHKDASTGEQVRAKNVVVMWAKYTQQNKKDAHGSVTYDITLAGEGKAAVFKNGARINGTWKAEKNQPPHFYDEAGQEVKLNPGNTWFEVPPKDIAIKTSGSTK